MVDDLDVERTAYLVQALCRQNVFVARRRIPAWVIVDKDQASRIMFQCTPENCSRMDRDLAQGSLLQPLIRDETPGLVEEEDAKRFVGE